MANKRMFSKTIVDSDAFLEMPLSTQALYFHLSMRADDDGFLNNAKKIMRLICANQNDYDLLLVKKFIIQFEDGICVIKHWRINNYLRKDRYKETIYSEEKSMLNVKENGAYTLDKNKGIPLVYQKDTKLIPGQPSIDKNSLEEKSIDQSRVEKNNSELFSLFEELGFGSINQILANDLLDMEKEFSTLWVKEAMEEAVRQGVRNLKYVLGILKTWKSKGFRCDKPKKQNSYCKKEAGSGFNNFEGRNYSERYFKLQELVLIGQATDEEKREFNEMRGIIN